MATHETPVLRVLHDHDGDWCFVGEGGAEDLRLLHVAYLVEHDPTLADIADLEPGQQVWRDTVGGPWQRSPIVLDD